MSRRMITGAAVVVALILVAAAAWQSQAGVTAHPARAWSLPVLGQCPCGEALLTITDEEYMQLVAWEINIDRREAELNQRERDLNNLELVIGRPECESGGCFCAKEAQ